MAHSRNEALRRSSSSRFSSPTSSRGPKASEYQLLIPKETRSSTSFTWDSRFLPAWAPAEQIWDTLPAELKSLLACVGNAGAGVQTALERLEKIQAKRPKQTTAFKDATASDIIAAKLQAHQNRGRTRSSLRDKEPYDCSPLSPEWRRIIGNVTSARATPATSNAASEVGSNGLNSSCVSIPSPKDNYELTCQISPIEAMPPVFPVRSSSPSADPIDLDLGVEHDRRNSEVVMRALHGRGRRESDLSRTRSNSLHPSQSVTSSDMPRDPLSTQYHAELEFLRKEILIRLRHNIMAVDSEWRNHVKVDEDTFQNKTPFEVLMIEKFEGEFEEWWATKKAVAEVFEEDIHDLAEGVEFSLGWSDNPGLNKLDI